MYICIYVCMYVCISHRDLCLINGEFFKKIAIGC